MNLAQRLQDLRKNAGYSQEEVAERLDVSRQAVSKWESGQGNPEVENIIKLAEIFHVSTDFILLGREREVVMPLEKAGMSKEARIAFCIIGVLAACAVITVCFIASLTKITGGW